MPSVHKREGRTDTGMSSGNRGHLQLLEQRKYLGRSKQDQDCYLRTLNKTTSEIPPACTRARADLRGLGTAMWLNFPGNTHIQAQFGDAFVGSEREKNGFRWPNNARRGCKSDDH